MGLPIKAFANPRPTGHWGDYAKFSAFGGFHGIQITGLPTNITDQRLHIVTGLQRIVKVYDINEIYSNFVKNLLYT